MAAHFLGIDLGTTNSVAVLSDGERLTPVRTSDGANLLPSVVRIDARQNVIVGARARRFLDTDPENTRSEFKRLMGSGRKITFKSAKLERTPEELSSLVLSTLRTQAEQALGHPPTAAVVTVPALFELPQTRATSEAARLAGFERVEHIQEPVASALTAGWKRGEDTAPWLVYDLGGGTFDVSMLETREGVLRVIDHDGDNFLGGRDMDTRLLDYVLEELSLRRDDPALVPVVRRLRSACEDAKIELGTGKKEASISLADPIVVGGDELLVDIAISKKKLDDLVLPIIDRSIEVCLRLIGRQGLEPSGIGRIVLVGGPTVMLSLRERLSERLGISLATDVDPMTAVAEGAAFFAAEHDLRTDSARPSKAPPQRVPQEKVWLQYPSVSGDLFPYVVGRVESKKLKSVRIDRSDGAFTSALEKIDEDGSFVVQVELKARALSTFRIVGLGDDGEIALDPSEVTIRHGLSLADPPLSRTIGVALADGGVAVYFERGAPLPSRKSFRLRTSLTVHPGQKESAISVPIVQGEVEIAHLCRLVGTIEIKPSALTTVLPAGSLVDVVLDLDRGGRLTATASLPERGNISFPGTLVLVAPDAPLDQLEAQLQKLQAKTETLYTDPLVDEAGRRKLIGVDRLLEDATREVEAARATDADALEKLRRLLIEADGGLADVEGMKAWPELEERAARMVSIAVHWVSRTGTEMERRTLDEAMRSLDRARVVKNPSEFTKRLGNVTRLANACAMRDPDVVTRCFHRACASLAEMRDPRTAKQIVARGEAALGRADIEGVRHATYELWDLLPPEEQTRARAHGSGVEL
jgi:molecular chaperone DnaK